MSETLIGFLKRIGFFSLFKFYALVFHSLSYIFQLRLICLAGFRNSFFNVDGDF